MTPGQRKDAAAKLSSVARALSDAHHALMDDDNSPNLRDYYPDLQRFHDALGRRQRWHTLILQLREEVSAARHELADEDRRAGSV